VEAWRTSGTPRNNASGYGQPKRSDAPAASTRPASRGDCLTPIMVLV
jgi:hypothetical protein